MEARRSLLLACCLALASSFTPHLEALETLEETQMLRYACIDDKGRTTCIIEMLVRPNPAGGIEIISTDSMGRREYARLNAAMLQKENTWLDDRSLFFILPAILDPKIIGGEARFVLVRTEGGQRAAMLLRAEGVAEVTDYSGNKELAYRISMGLADPIGRLFWPYTYNYYYRVQDLRFLVYDGPDEKKRNSRIILIDAAITRSE